MNNEECKVLKYYQFLGKKWSYPILFHMSENKKYGFDNFLYFTNRKISRSVLLLFLKEAIGLKIIYKENKKYSLTKFGLTVKKSFINIKKELEKHDKDLCNDCSLYCKVNKNRL